MALLRYQSLVTGVAGSPAYLTAYAEMDFVTSGQDFVDGLEDFYAACALGMVDAATITGASTIEEIDPTTGSLVNAAPVTGYVIAGSGGVEVLPRSTQLLVRLVTGAFVGGRQVRGRWNIPYISVAQNTNGGQPETALKAGVDAAALVLMSSSTYSVEVYSPTNGASYPVETMTCSDEWAVLRSRRD